MKHSGGSVLLRGCFGYSGTGNLQQEERKMDLIKCQEIQGENIMFVRRLKLTHHRSFQQDNDPKHTPKLVSEEVLEDSSVHHSLPP